MSLELARFLVERGLVDAGRMDDVLQRQVLFGGGLDTNLLEADLLDEPTVTRALGEFHQLPVAGPELLATRDPRMPKLFPARLAQKYQVVPVAMSGRALVVLAAGRIDPLWVDEINFMLSLSVRTHLVCEARLQALMREWLGLEIEPRLAALADRLGPLGLPPAPPAPEPEIEEGTSPEAAAAREALAAVVPAPAAPSTQADPPPARTVREDESRVRVAQALGTLAARDAVERARRELARSGQLSLAEAAELCLSAPDRDAIVDVLLRYSRQFMEFVGLFVVQEEALFGWDAVGSLDARERIRRVRLPRGAPSVLRTALQTGSASLGPVPSSGNNQELLQTLGRSRPLNALVAPILVHGRTVAVLYGDAGVRSIRGHRIGELLVFLSRLSEAFERLILRRKGFDPGTVPAARASLRGLHPVSSPPPPAAVEAPVEAPAEPQDDRWQAAASRTLELPVVEAPPLEVDGQAGWADGGAPGAEARSTQEGLTLEGGEDEPLELEAAPGPPPAPPEDETDFSSLRLDAEPAPKVGEDLFGAEPPAAEPPAAEPPAAEPPVPEATTAFAAPPPPPPELAALPELPLGEVPDDYMLGGELSPVIEAAALDVPAAPPVREERVRVEDVEDGLPATVVTSVDTDADVVVVDTAEDFAPGVARPEEEPGPAPVLTPGHPFPAAVTPLELEDALARDPGRTAPPPAAPLEALEVVEVGPPSVSAAPPEAPDLEVLTGLALQLVGTDREAAVRARAELVRIGPPALAAIMPLFPGRLLFDVRGSHDRIPPLQEHGELLACLVEIGPEACPAVADRLEAPDPLVRYYAVSFLGVVPSARVVGRLAGRLYDRDARVRLTAIEVLGCYRRTPGYEAMLKSLRARLKGEDPDQQAIAAALLGNFRDVESLPDLVMLLGAGARVAARAAAESLAYITKADLGSSERRWLKWWREHKGESRVVWLIDGLRSKNRDIRFSSAQELARLTQETFGYYFDAERSDRERAVRQWERWWEEKGKHQHLDA